MRFDKTFIAIRERNVLEIFDLALHVITDHFVSLFWLFVIGVAPWVLIDMVFVGWMLDADEYFGFYYWVMFLLIVSQAQAGTTFMTQYLGRAMFVGRPGVWAPVKDVFSSSPYFIWSHGILRTVFLTLAVCLLLSETDYAFSMVVCFLFLPGMVGLGLAVRAFRPFVSEILLLERTPVSKKDPEQVYFARRSKALHVSSSSDLFGRFALCSILAVPLGFACFSMLVSIDSVLNIQANSEYSYSPYYWVVALWVVAGFVCVARFLSYIDTRIRQEGWAVELRMRAEGQILLDTIE